MAGRSHSSELSCRIDPTASRISEAEHLPKPHLRPSRLITQAKLQESRDRNDKKKLLGCRLHKMREEILQDLEEGVPIEPGPRRAELSRADPATSQRRSSYRSSAWRRSKRLLKEVESRLSKCSNTTRSIEWADFSCSRPIFLSRSSTEVVRPAKSRMTVHFFPKERSQCVKKKIESRPVDELKSHPRQAELFQRLQ